jgi:hypothetical protein
MSWDISVFAANEPPPPVSQMPKSWRCAGMGSLDDVRAKISECLPKVDWSDKSWGLYDGEGFSYEFNIGRHDPGNGFMIHVRGGGDAITPLLQLASRWDWYLLDCSQGEWLHHCSEPKTGWSGFQAYRDRVLSHATKTESKKEGK